MTDYHLSKHFQFSELTGTSRAELQEENRNEAHAYLPSLIHLCIYILEPLRAQFGPLKVNSGFRCREVNEAVGGSPTSQHAVGEAADVNAEDDSDEKRVEMAKWLLKSGIPFGQALIEGGCLHVSLPGKHLNQIARAERVDGKWALTPLA